MKKLEVRELMMNEKAEQAYSNSDYTVYENNGVYEIKMHGDLVATLNTLEEVEDFFLAEMYYTITDTNEIGRVENEHLYTFEEVKTFFNAGDEVKDMYDLEDFLNEEYEGMRCPYEVKESEELTPSDAKRMNEALKSFK